MNSVKEMILIPKEEYDSLQNKGFSTKANKKNKSSPFKITEIQGKNDDNLNELILDLPKQHRTKAKGLLKWIQKHSDNNFYIDEDYLVNMDGNVKEHILDYLRYVSSPFVLKNKPKSLNIFYKKLKEKNVPSLYLPIKKPFPFLNSAKPKIKKWIKIREKNTRP